MGARFRSLWDEYERGDTPEARFVMAVDRMAPMLLNTTEGGTTWREHGITRERVIQRNGPHIQPALPAVWEQALAMLDAATAAGHIERG
jgi:putative hydrolase of HD superfamily